MQEQPLISVLMGVYYHKPSLEPLMQAVVSILHQDWTQLELIVCDEGSSAAAQAYLEQHSREDSRLRLVRGQGKKLLPEKLNACLAAAHGQWIARMDDDDLSYPQRLRQQISFLQSHPEIAFVGCQVDYLLGDGVTHSNFPAFPTPRDFFFAMPYIHPTLLFRRAALEQVGGYDESPVCHLCEDYDLLLRLYQAGFQGANVSEALFGYSLAGTEQKKRPLSARWNEVRVRYRGFWGLGLLPGALPYVVKPLAVGLLPVGILNRLRRGRLKRRMAQGKDVGE
ncbi:MULTISPECIES: glycosyltransferase [unclassified Oscillibacter]|uniref:glycosyltransferase n=1 Tax=unclassified Oscillibacter TaxID=2629304 RepID=UPI0025EC526A|nr:MULTISPECIES: glycosyltransferase [unclassified Oscillibacter]